NIYEWTHPHLAKYAMALGIVAFAGHDVAASSDLGVPVRDATIEPRREDPVDTGRRAGDRAWVATGSEVIADDLQSRGVVARWSVPGASAVAFDDSGSRILIGTDAGEVWTIDGQGLDLLAGSPSVSEAMSPDLVATIEGAVTRIGAFRDGSHAAVVTGDTVDVV